MRAREVFTSRPAEHAFTYAYAQPDEYHFCLDSIILAYFVSRQLPENAPEVGDFRALDLCAGCGVVGLELAYYRPWIEPFDFLEIQPLFRPFFEKNLRITGKEERRYRFIESHLNALKESSFSARYDLIVANPPYFRKGEGMAPSGIARHRARFFEDATPLDLMRGIANALKPKGKAYVLMRPAGPHGRDDALELTEQIPKGCVWGIPAEIRGTWVVEIEKSG